MQEKRPVIILVEDDVDLAYLNARLLKRNGYDVLIAQTARQGIELARDNETNLFILDIGLPDFDGISLCKEIRQITDAPIIFLTGRTEIADKVTGLGAGGDYYLTKPFEKQELLAVVQTLLRREEQNQKKLEDAVSIKSGSLIIEVHERKVYLDQEDVPLSPKEFDILYLLVQNREQELTYDEIYSSVWNAPMFDDSRVIRKTISRLKQKLGEEDRDDFAILNIQGKGYVFTTT